MNHVINKLIKEDTQDTRYAKVTAKIASLRYEVTDVHGRSWTVDAQKEWSVGDYVFVQLGWITGRSGTPVTPKHFSV